ncbi:MAG: MFS transporter, partial [Clostridia bacterium]|nr:MFS transporter [Clostridia bacterium]
MKKSTLLFLLKLTSFWFWVNFLWGAMLSIVIPSQVNFIVGNSAKSSALGTVLSIGAVVAMFTQPLFGSLSDRCNLRLGRRRPFVIFGVLMCLIPLGMMAFTKSFVLYCVGFLLLQLFANIATAGFQGLIPDTVSEKERGTAASFMGGMTFLGTIAGILISGSFADSHQYPVIYLAIAVLLVLCMVITVLGVKESPYDKHEPFQLKKFIRTFYINPHEHPDFIWMLVSTFFIMLGFYLLFFYQQYYISDVLGSKQPATDTTLVSTIIIIGAAVVSVLAGKFSDKLGRKAIVAMSVFCMAVMALALALHATFVAILILAMVFGFGYGGYTSVQWALVTDILPGADDSAKDLGIWGISSTLPQVIGPMIGGAMIAAYKTTNIFYGYRLMYILVIASLAAGGLMVYKIKNAR